MMLYIFVKEMTIGVWLWRICRTCRLCRLCIQYMQEMQIIQSTQIMKNMQNMQNVQIMQNLHNCSVFLLRNRSFIPSPWYFTFFSSKLFFSFRVWKKDSFFKKKILPFLILNFSVIENTTFTYLLFFCPISIINSRTFLPQFGLVLNLASPGPDCWPVRNRF